MPRLLILFTIILISSCEAQEQQSGEEEAPSAEPVSILKQRVNEYRAQHPDTDEPSQSVGTVGNGSLKGGKLMPFFGDNFEYFDTTSYFADRAFVHEDVRSLILDSYAEMDSITPGRKFYLMECSLINGGQIPPHRTHQNGSSVDFMMPKLKDGEPYTRLDTMGINHYLLSFDDHGRLKNDTSISVDFQTVAQHIIVLDRCAQRYGMRIGKVIFNVEMQVPLYSTPAGQKLKQSDIYLTKRLTPMINALHDDHYHVDFVKVE